MAVLRERGTRELEIGEKRLHVAQRDLACCRIPNMADRSAAAQSPDDFLGAEIIADMAKSAVRVELPTIIGDDAGGLLAAMLQRVQPQRSERRRIGVPIHPEHAAFFMEMIGVQGIVRHHRRSSSRDQLHNYFINQMRVGCAQPCYRAFSMSRFMSLRSPCL